MSVWNNVHFSPCRRWPVYSSTHRSVFAFGHNSWWKLFFIHLINWINGFTADTSHSAPARFKDIHEDLNAPFLLHSDTPVVPLANIKFLQFNVQTDILLIAGQGLKFFLFLCWRSAWVLVSTEPIKCELSELSSSSQIPSLKSLGLWF